MIIKLPFGLREGKLIHISDISDEENGLKCNCICPECHKQLQARKGNIRVHHFAHNNTACKAALETSLHMFAKEVLERNKRLMLPPLEYEYKGYNYFNIGTPRFEERIIYRKEREDCIQIEFDRVEIEKNIGGIRPDIILYKKSSRLLVEITVTHKVDSDKKNIIKEMNESAIEISLNPKNYDFYTFDKSELENELIYSIENKKWVNNKTLSRKIGAKELDEEKERELKIIEHNRLLVQNETQRTKRIKDLQKYVEQDFTNNKISELRNKLSYDKRWRENLEELGLDSQNLPEFINVSIPGELAINCHRIIWQSMLINEFIKGNKGKALYVEDIIEWMQVASGLPLNDELKYTKDIVEIEVPDLEDCILNYMKLLEGYSIVTYMERSGINKSRFIVHYDNILKLSGMNKLKIQGTIKYEIENSKINGVEHPLLDRIAICRVCGKKTSEWVSLDGETNICLCRECAYSDKGVSSITK